ncbi:hypothetical protein Tco_0098153 [Tanacetum coccineum]
MQVAKVPLFFWAEAIATTCFTQNRSLIIPRHKKTLCHIINGRKPSVKFFHIFGSLCYIVRDGENLDKMKEKGDALVIIVGILLNQEHIRFFFIKSPLTPSQENVPQAVETVTMSNKLDLLFSPMFDELLNGTTQVVSKSSAVHAANAPDKRQQQNTTQYSTTTVAADAPPLNIQTTHDTTTQAPTVTATENINQADTNKENAQVEEDEFINIFSTPVQERGETSSRHVDSSNMHTFYQRHPSKHRWTKDHPLEQVIGNPSQSIRTRRQLEIMRYVYVRNSLTGLVSRKHRYSKKDHCTRVARLEGDSEIIRCACCTLIVWIRSKITRKIVKSDQHDTESEEFKKKPKIQSLSQFSSTRAILAISKSYL